MVLYPVDLSAFIVCCGFIHSSSLSFPGMNSPSGPLCRTRQHHFPLLTATKRLWHCRCLCSSFILNQKQTFVRAFVTRNLFIPTQHQEPAGLCVWNFACARSRMRVHTAAIVLVGKRPHKDSTHICPRIQTRQHSLGPAITWRQESSDRLLDIKPTWRREEILLPSAARDLRLAQILTPPLTFRNRKEADGWDTSPALGTLRRETVSRWTVLASNLSLIK